MAYGYVPLRYHNGAPFTGGLAKGVIDSGAGVGFFYWHMKGMPPFLAGRANTGRPNEEGLEKTAGKRTGVRVKSFQTSSVTKAENGLLEALSQGPVMIRVDILQAMSRILAGCLDRLIFHFLYQLMFKMQKI